MNGSGKGWLAREGCCVRLHTRITPEGTTEVDTRVGGRTQPSHFFPASLSSPILAVLPTVGGHVASSPFTGLLGGPSPCRVAGSWSCRSRLSTPWLSLPQCPSLFVLSRASTVSSVGGIVVVGFLLSHPFPPWALPRAEVRSVSGPLLVQLSPFAVFLGIRAGADVRMMWPGSELYGAIGRASFGILARFLGPWAPAPAADSCPLSPNT